jgi:PAS domain S-box-containing protein
MTPPARTLLLVENTLCDQERYRHYLGSDPSCTYRFLEAESTAAGLALCRTQTIDAILLDSNLPDASGLEFLEMLYTHSGEECPPVVMIADSDGSVPSVALSMAIRAIKLGAENYLLKHSLTPESLQIAVGSAIENARLRSQLRQSDNRFRVSIENMLDCFGICLAIRDELGQIIDFQIDYLNAAALESNQMTQDDIGKRLCEVFPAHYETGLFEEYCRVVETGAPLIKENLIYSDIFGSQHLTRAYEIHASKLGDGFVASWRDITDRKQAKAALEQTNSILEAVIMGATDVVFVKDLQGRYVIANPTAAEWLNTSVEAMLGQDDTTFFPPEVAQQIMHSDRQIIQFGEPIVYEEEMPRQGEVRSLLSAKYPWRDAAGNVLGVVGISRDITTLKATEAEREQLLQREQSAREEAEAANRSKDEFVAVVAHELRSPLNAISGWAKLLQTRKFEKAMLEKALDTIVRNTQTQVQLVEDLLDISRMVKGTLQITSAPVNLSNVIEAVLDNIHPMADAKGIRLQTHLTLVPQISGDFYRLQQIAVNLLTNAIKFTPAGGQIEIELEPIDNQVLLRVSDTGKGIAPEFLPFIFERFQQGQQSIRSKDGLGLGLAIVKNLVALHGGTITAESAGVGRGSTFTVRLPRLEIAAIDQSRPVGARGTDALSGIRILAVDDEPDILELIAFVLQDVGAEVKAVTEATAALDCVTQFKPDILISDIAMPGGNGYELVQQIKSYPEGRIPAIALTAYASTTYEERSLQAGFQRHLTKPVEPGDLIAAILNLVRGAAS